MSHKVYIRLTNPSDDDHPMATFMYHYNLLGVSYSKSSTHLERFTVHRSYSGAGIYHMYTSVLVSVSSEQFHW